MARGVVINGRFLSRRVTGVERYAREISQRFLPNVRMIYPPKPVQGKSGHLWEQLILPFRLHSSDILWSPANSGPLTVGKQVLSLHDTSVLDHPEWFKPSYVRWYKYLLPRLINTVQQIITMSEFSKKRIEKKFNLPAEKVTLISEGVDTYHFFPRREPEIMDIRQRYSLKGDFLLTVATLEPRKNIDRLLQAWNLVSPELINTTLVIAGGTYPVFQEVKIENPVNNVHWLGYVDEQDLPALYSSANAFVLPSLYEGFGLSALEAMACGTAVIVSKNGALPEVVGESGIFVDPQNVDSIANAIETILCNPQLRNDLSKKGLERAQLFSWDFAAKQVWQVLQEVSM